MCYLKYYILSEDLFSFFKLCGAGMCTWVQLLPEVTDPAGAGVTGYMTVNK